MNIRKLFEDAIAKAAPMPIQQFRKPGRNMVQKAGMLPSKLQPKPYMTPNGGTSQFLNRPTNAGSLNPGAEDGYDTEIAHLRGNFQTQQVNPVDMDPVPRNLQMGRHPAYFQGSNPHLDGENWVDPQMQDYGPGGGIQSSSFGSWQPRKRY